MGHISCLTQNRNTTIEVSSIIFLHCHPSKFITWPLLTAIDQPLVGFSNHFLWLLHLNFSRSSFDLPPGNIRSAAKYAAFPSNLPSLYVVSDLRVSRRNFESKTMLPATPWTLLNIRSSNIYKHIQRRLPRTEDLSWRGKKFHSRSYSVAFVFPPLRFSVAPQKSPFGAVHTFRCLPLALLGPDIHSLNKKTWKIQKKSIFSIFYSAYLRFAVAFAESRSKVSRKGSHGMAEENISPLSSVLRL